MSLLVWFFFFFIQCIRIWLGNRAKLASCHLKRAGLLLLSSPLLLCKCWHSTFTTIVTVLSNLPAVSPQEPVKGVKLAEK